MTNSRTYKLVSSRKKNKKWKKIRIRHLPMNLLVHGTQRTTISSRHLRKNVGEKLTKSMNRLLSTYLHSLLIKLMFLGSVKAVSMVYAHVTPTSQSYMLR